MSPSQSSFRLEAIYQLDLFAKWTCICEICFSDFLPILISAGDCFWQLDLYEKWSCIYEWRVFSNFVPILISAGGILTNWICSQSDHVFAVEGFLISFLSSLWQECSYCLHQSSPFDLKVWQIFRRGSFSLDSFPVVHCSSIRDVFLKRISNLFVWLVYPLGKPPPTKTYEFSEKFRRGGGVISNPKIFIANFGLLNRVFLA